MLMSYLFFTKIVGFGEGFGGGYYLRFIFILITIKDKDVISRADKICFDKDQERAFSKIFLKAILDCTKRDWPVETEISSNPGCTNKHYGRDGR